MAVAAAALRRAVHLDLKDVLDLINIVKLRSFPASAKPHDTGYQLVRNNLRLLGDLRVLKGNQRCKR